MIITRSTKAIFLLWLVLAISCGDNTPTGHRGGPIDTHFPNAIGMLWKYQVYDSLTETTDTVWISITDTATLGADDFVAERREKRIVMDYFGWSYLHVRGDTVEFFDDSPGVPANERIVFPLELGSTWTGPTAANDTSRVTLVGRIEVPAAIFNNGARINRSWNLDFEGGGNWSQTWVVPDAGVVSRYRRSQYSVGTNIVVTTNEVWELIEYDLALFRLHQFPNRVGTAWVYEEIDSVTSAPNTVTVTFDTVTVTIVNSGRLESGDLYTIWEFMSRNGIDTQYVVTTGERMSFQQDTIFSPLWDLYYDFPLAVGRTWGIDFFVPVPEVLDKGPVPTPVQHFASGFHTRMYGGGFNDYWTQEDWLVTGVGIAKSRRWQIGFIPWMNRTWTLIDYHLTN
jgi:hypothetical protein